jgi:hypothetical protein
LQDLLSKITKAKWTEDVAQAVDSSFASAKPLVQSPVLPKTKNKIKSMISS